MTYLLDTNVVSEGRRTRPDAGVVSWLTTVDEDDLFISVITLGEIRRGIERLRLRKDHQQAATYDAWLDTTARSFAERVVPVTTAVADTWGRIGAGRQLPTADGLIAATAITHGWTLATRNVRDVDGTGVRVLNPFEDTDPR